ncbi:MAG: CDP-diacylglycerol--glycerol-3-phosphate 3-phosphatidyltransferase [Treponema sp.]|nr:CDP-diacylglycerol--glycerol-3-phosphate 3-phosphatidyltransferase [Treponema sp.]
MGRERGMEVPHRAAGEAYRAACRGTVPELVEGTARQCPSLRCFERRLQSESKDSDRVAKQPPRRKTPSRWSLRPAQRPCIEAPRRLHGKRRRPDLAPMFLDIINARLHTEAMTLADKVTSLRLVLAPFFFVVYLLPVWFPDAMNWTWTVPVLWVLFLVSELTDMLDGKIARARNEVSALGKLLDPFADVLVRITYFLCFVLDGILPSPLLLLVLYREFSIQFVRNLILQKGVVQGARMGGKIKAVAYMVAGGIALMASSARALGFEAVFMPLRISAMVIFGISVVFAVISFMDYLSVYRNMGA